MDSITFPCNISKLGKGAIVMRDRFVGFERPTEAQFENLWRDAIFVFDANVLLNIYRFPAHLRDSMINAIAKLEERVWLPYHAALEFNRNRAKVISNQKSQIRDTINSVSVIHTTVASDVGNLHLMKPHSPADPREYLKTIQEAGENLASKIRQSESDYKDLSELDGILEKISILFNGKIGSAPDQIFIDECAEEHKWRHEYNVPPGARDESKSEKYFYNGVRYEARHGDLIIWKEIINHFISTKETMCIFVTDDRKDDWWHIVSGRTLGPRPELHSEISTLSSVESFYMYDSASFLNGAKKYLGEQIDEISVSNASAILSEYANGRNRNQYSSTDIREAIAVWIKSIIKTITSFRESTHPLDMFAIERHGGEIYIKTIYIDDENDIGRSVDAAIFATTITPTHGTIELPVVVASNKELASRFIEKASFAEKALGIRPLGVGYMDFSNGPWVSSLRPPTFD